MAYDPFARGPQSVRTSRFEAVDASRDDRRLAVTTWLPGRSPAALVVYSHSSYGHARQSSFLCEHLASHGYLVVAPDHAGSTTSDLAVARGLAPADRDRWVRRMVSDRVPDLRAVLDAAVAGAAEVAVDVGRIGVVGWSFGGWAALAALEVDDRFRAVVALAPGGSRDPLPGIIRAPLTFAWQRPVPSLFLAADRDRSVPLDRVRDVYERAPEPKRWYILRDADHGHFADDVPPGMCPAEAAHRFTRALALAHCDAVLRDDAGARTFLDGDVIAALRAAGIDASAG